ncbi:MAG: cytochrome c biogenesis protein ResB, partial [Anaerolineae bacterium]
MDGESRPEPLSVLWRVLAAPQTLLVLAGLLALLLALASLVPQIPAQALNDPQAWLASQPASVGRRGGIVSSLGLYNVYHGLAFRLLLALLALTVFVRLVDAAELAWRAAGWSMARPPGGAGQAGRGAPAWPTYAPRVSISSPLSLDEVSTRLGAFLDRHGYRHKQLAGEAPARWLASRRPALLWAQPLGYAALLVAAAGLAISGYWGWQDAAWRPLPGDMRLVGHGSAYGLRLDDFEMQTDEQGHLAGYTSRVSWLEGTGVAAEAVVTAHRPATFEGLTLHQLGYLPSVRVRAWEGSNRLALEAGGEAQPGAREVEVRFVEADEQPLILIPAQERLLALVFEPMCHQGQPALHVDSLTEGEEGRQRLGTLTASGEVKARDLRLEIDLSYRPVLRLDHRPGLGLVVGGLSAAVLALLAGWLAPAWVMFLAAGPGEEGGSLIQIVA